MNVFVAGVGQIAVSDYRAIPLEELAIRASVRAVEDAGVDKVDAVVIGSMLSSEVSGGSYLGPPVAMAVSNPKTESYLVNAACASGGAAIRQAELAILSGQCNTVLAVGVEKMCGVPKDDLRCWLASASDSKRTNFLDVNSELMRRYLLEYEVDREAFHVFSQVAHDNAVTNPFAMLRGGLEKEQYESSRMVSRPIRLHDCPPIGDGAAAVVLSSKESGVRLSGSGWATGSIGLNDPLWLDTVHQSTHIALERSNKLHGDIDLFELHDAFTIFSCLVLESSGFVPRGKGTEFATNEGIDLKGILPISTFGGLKARGHPVGASGVYQVVDATLQLRGDAGLNQVPDVTVAMTQNMGGNASTVITFVLEKV